MLKSVAPAVLSLLSACNGTTVAGPPQPSGGRLSPVAAMTRVETEGFARALEPREFVFPADHGPHPDFKLEWWYFVGNLEDESGRRFGYQLTFFRQALVPSMPERRSAWAAAQLYMGHFALSDIGGERFFSSERTSRGAAGLAGARSSPFEVWIESWSAESVGEGFFPLRLGAENAGIGLELTLESEKPLVLQGEKGLSQKGPEPGDASYYYSYTRMPARGTVTVDGRSFRVRGSGWLDREWSTGSLDEAHEGWDWFALQLGDGRDLMLFQLRLAGGGIEPRSHGTMVSPAGVARTLHTQDFDLEVLRKWTSPNGTAYPAGWRLAIPSEELVLTIEPLLADQELDVSFRYWEGAVGVRGEGASKGIGGRGYVELVGYEP